MMCITVPLGKKQVMKLMTLSSSCVVTSKPVDKVGTESRTRLSKGQC